jgi:hypothetical protein
VRVQGVLSCPNDVPHGWLKQELTAILADLPPSSLPLSAEAVQDVWRTWASGLTSYPTLPVALPPVRLLLVLDNLKGHQTPEFVLWLFEHGILPLYTPLGGSWLNMAESIQRILQRRALAGQQPETPE